MRTDAVTQADTGTTGEPLRKRPRGKLPRWASALIVFGLVLVVGSWLLQHLPPSEQPFIDYIAECRARGEPTTWDEYRGESSTSEAEVFSELTAVRDRLVAQRGAMTGWLPGGFWNRAQSVRAQDAPSKDESRAMSKTLDELRPALHEIASLVARPRTSVEVDLSAEPSVIGPQLMVLRDTNLLLRAFAAGSSHADERLIAIECLLRMARANRRTVGQEQVFCMMSASDGLWWLRSGIESGELDAFATRARFAALLSQGLGPTPGDVSRSLRMHSIAMFRSVQSGGRLTGDITVLFDPREHVAYKRLSGWRSGGEFPGGGGDVAFACRMLDRCARDEPSLRSWRERIDAEAGTVPASSIAYPLVTTMLSKSTSMVVLLEARSRLARLALAAAEHRIKHDHFPASLDELTWAFPDGLPLDPYTDAPFVYERPIADARIASVGWSADDPAIDEAELRERCLVWELKR